MNPQVVNKEMQFYAPVTFHGYKFHLRGITMKHINSFTAELTFGCAYCGGWVDRFSKGGSKCMRCKKPWRAQFNADEVNNGGYTVSSIGLCGDRGDFISWGDRVDISPQSESVFEQIVEFTDCDAYEIIIDRNGLMEEVESILFDPTRQWWVQ